MKNSKEKISIHLSYLLRHASESAKLDMDRHGWVSVTQLIENVNESGKAQLSEKLLQEIVETENKGRYCFSSDGKRIKACHGHSIPWVAPELETQTPPEFLYHGTTTEALADIMKSGAILKMKRHTVHLQADIAKAWQSATRRKNKTPVVLKIAAERMHCNGAEFSISENEVWFCERVPSIYIAECIYD